MKLIQLRRKINDSHIGQFVNRSIPGVLVEGLSAAFNDRIERAVLNAWMVLDSGTYSPPDGSDSCELSALAEKFDDELRNSVNTYWDTSRLRNLENAYSHTSRLYVKARSAVDGKEFIFRVPLKVALGIEPLSFPVPTYSIKGVDHDVEPEKVFNDLKNVKTLRVSNNATYEKKA